MIVKKPKLTNTSSLENIWSYLKKIPSSQFGKGAYEANVTTLLYQAIPPSSIYGKDWILNRLSSKVIQFLPRKSGYRYRDSLVTVNDGNCQIYKKRTSKARVLALLSDMIQAGIKL